MTLQCVAQGGQLVTGFQPPEHHQSPGSNTLRGGLEKFALAEVSQRHWTVPVVWKVIRVNKFKALGIFTQMTRKKYELFDNGETVRFPPAPAILRDALRAATADVHERLHHHIAFARVQAGTIERDDYIKLLSRLYGFYNAFEAAARARTRADAMAGNRFSGFGRRPRGAREVTALHVPTAFLGMSRSMLKIAVRALPRLMITRPLMSHQVRSGWRDGVAVRRAGWAVGHGLSTA